MSAITAHGLRIAAGGSIENGVFERLAADPTPIVPGRVWYNETEKVMKLSSLNATGAVVVEVFSTGAELVAAIAQEVTDREGADDALGVRIDNLLSNLDPAAVDSMTEMLAAFQAADSDLSAAITAALSTHTDELTSAIGSLEAADAGLGGRRVALESSVGGSTGDNANLTTDHKLTLVGAINEVDGNADANSASIATTNGTVASNKAAIEGALATETQARIDGDSDQATALNGYKTSNDAALAQEVTDRTSGDTANAAAISAEETRATAAEGVNATAISTETTRATAAEGVLTSDLSAEVARATAAEGVNAQAIADESTAARAAEAAVQAALDAYELSNDAALAAEVLARGNADDALGSRIDDVLSNLDPAALDSLTEVVAAFQSADGALQSAITAALGTHTSELAAAETRLDAEDVRIAGLVAAEASTARTAEGVNATAIATEETRAKAAEAQNASDIAAETTRATAAEGVNAAAITAEASTARAAEGQNASDIAAETTRATAAEGVNATAIATEKSRAEAAEGVLQGNIDSEETARIAADSQLRSDINGGKFTHQSAAAALVHTISHGLNSAFINFTLMVAGEDGVYRNDLAPVTEVDNNTLKVELTQASNVKLAVEAMGEI